MKSDAPPARKPREDGMRTRKAILLEAVSLATVVGLEGLSIGELAKALGISKSGLYAHFGSKQELQLATIDEAERIFNILAAEGSVSMSCQETFWAYRFGMCTDRFGIPWMVNCARPLDDVRAPRAA